jgi:hypothetical protein
MYPNIEGKVKMRIPSFKIPDSTEFPEKYRGATVEVGTWWPGAGLMKHVLDEPGGLERLEECAIGLVLGHVRWEDGCSEVELREGYDYLRVTSRDGRVLLDSFDWERVRPDPDYVQ